MIMCKKTFFLITLVLAMGLGAGVVSADRIPVPAGFPNASNTGIAGVGLTEEDLTTYTGPYTITTDDTVVDKKLFSGQINIQADNVTIKRCKNVSGGSWYGLNANYGYTGTIVEDCTFVGPDDGTRKAFLGYNMTVRRCNVYDYGDCLYFGSNTVIEDNYFHDLSTVPGAHNDCIQTNIAEISNVTIEHNTLQALYQDQTSAIIMSTSGGTLNNVMIDGNFLSGGAYTVYSRDKGNGYGPPTNVTIQNNVFEYDSYAFGHLSYDGSPTFLCNVWHTGSPIPQNPSCDSNDTDPPSPDPMTWATEPYATGDSSISMTATTATDTSGVEYYFDETSGNPGGSDSGWQDSTTYEDTGLSASTQYTYKVKARDKSSNQNETAYSTSKSATTDAADTTAPSPDPMTWATEPNATGASSISMTATTATDESGVEYYFDETSANPGGSDSGWQDSTTYQDTGLDPNTQYTYKVKARDKSANQNETGYSTSKSATTDAESAADIEFDAVSSNSSNVDGTTLSWSHTIGSGDDRILIIGIGGEDDTSSDLNISSVKYNNVSMSLVTGSSATVGTTPLMKTELYYLLETDLPTSGAYTATVTYSGSVSSRTGGAISLVNVKQQAAEAVATNTVTNQATISTNVTTLTDGAWVVDTVGCGNPSAGYTTTTSGMVERYDENSGYSTGAGSTKAVATAGSTTMSWEYGGVGNRQAHSVAAFAPTSQAPPDTTAPTPDPMTWATDPYATGSTSISMTATTATDASGVEYYFDCIAGGGNDSGWQDSTTYEDTGLDPNTQYTYKVKARDKSSNQNETGYSTTKSATTDSASGTHIDATFDSDADGFTYADITNGSYVDGSWNASYGYSGGGIRVRTGPGPTGGATDGQYSDGFSLSSAGWVTITLRYRLEMGEGFESNEYGEAYLMIDSTRYGDGTGDSLVRIVGDGNGGGTDDSGWLSGDFDVSLSSGSHTIKVGAYNNDSTADDEWVNAYFDNVKVEDTNAPGDTTAPSPDPMTWATDPYATGTSSISMTATTATDASGVEYYFDCTTTGGHDSGWQDSTTYEDTGLSPATQYTYQVKARDKSSNQNETAYSTVKSATTQDGTAPSPDPMTWATEPYATGASSISMTATTATDASGVEYYFECTAGGGNSSGWQDSATYEDTGLDDLTEYTYRVKTRDKSSNQNETAYSTSQSATTEDGTAPSPDPITWSTEPYATGASSISMTATTATDPCGVEYYFDCTAGGGNDSGWQDSATYEDSGLDDLTQYTYQVKARDKSSNQNETAYSTTKSATTEDGTAPSPDPTTWSTEPYATGASSISMTATTATDPCGVEYYFDCTAGGGNDSGWQDSTTYEDTGLTPETQYTYKVQARDKSSNQNTTGWSTTKSATTDAISGEPNLVSWWELDESSGTTAADSSGNNHDGTLSGGSWAPTSGKFDGAVELGDVNSNRVEVPTTGMSASAATIAFWANLDDVQTGGNGQRYFFGHTSSPGSWVDRIQIYMNNSDTKLDLGLGDTHSLDSDIMTLSTSTWYHIALTWDGTNYVVYVDGIDKANGTYTGLSTLGSYADVGNNGGDTAARIESFKGLLDDVRIYDAALSKYDIADLAGITIASSPSPADEATGVSTTADLSWSAGYYAASTNGHDVYFGTDYNSVADANHSSAEFKGTQSSTTYDPGTLSASTTYYWAIDEVNDSNTWIGDVWSFTTEGAPAADVELVGSWVAGTSHTAEDGNDRVLVLTAHAEDDDSAMSITSVTYGGKSMTKVIEQNTAASGYHAYVGAFILNDADINDASGSSFVVTWQSNPFQTPNYGSAFFANVKQSDPNEAEAGNYNTSNDTVSTSALGTNDGDMVIVAATCGNEGSYAVNNGFTKGVELTITSADGVTGHKAASGSNETSSVTFTSGANRQAILGFVLNKTD